MGLASAMSTALTGMSAAETTINVVGNNLANSDTVGFKASQANFATQFLQTLSLGSAPRRTPAAPIRCRPGLRATVAGIAPNFSQERRTVSTPTDMAIQGDGFFIVQGAGGQQFFTRNGTSTDYEQPVGGHERQPGDGLRRERQLPDPAERQLTTLFDSAGRVEGGRGDAERHRQGHASAHRRRGRPPPRSCRRACWAMPPDSAPTIRAASCAGRGRRRGGDQQTPRAAQGSGRPGVGNTSTIVDADGPYNPTSPTTESSPSSPVTVNLGNGNNYIELSGIPTPSAANDYSYVRIYRTAAGGSTFYYDGEVNLAGCARRSRHGRGAATPP